MRTFILTTLLSLAWLGAAADGTGRLKSYDIWRDLPSERLMEMGGDFYQSDKPDSALMCFNIVANRYYTDKNGNKDELLQEAKAMSMLGILYTYYFIDYEKAHRNLLQAKKIAEETDNQKFLSAVYANLANIHWIDSFYSNGGVLNEQTIQMTLKGFETALEADYPEGVLALGFNIAKLASDSLHNAAVQNDFNQFLRYPIPDSMKQYEFIKNYSQSVVERQKRNFSASLELNEKALNCVYGKNDMERENSRITLILNKCYLLIQLGQDQAAMALYDDLINRAKANNEHHLLYFYYKVLWEVYSMKNDSILSEKYDVLALREKEFVLDKNKLLNAEKAEFLFQIDEINAEVQELTYHHRLMKIIAVSIATILLIILGFLYLLWRKYKQEQEKNRKLYENNLALLAAEDERRQRIIEAEQNKYQSHQMEEGEQSDLLHRIFYVMETSEEVYQDSFTLDRLAELVEAGSKYYVSQVLNDYYHQSFPKVVNEFRIREACRRINDRENYGQLTVEAIARSVGFNSYPNFVTNFKKFTGLTPSAYRKQGLTA